VPPGRRTSVREPEMCFFITIAVPAPKAALVPDVFGRGFRTASTANPAVVAALPTDYAPTLVTNGHCSCDLYAAPRSETEPDLGDHLRKKYAKRGWSDSKIARALEQAKARDSKNLHARGIHRDVVSRLQELCRAAGSVAVVVHWYSGQVETEQLSLRQAKPCDCAELPARAAALCEDEVLVAASRRAD
jgi:hypothetical protein